MSDFSINFNARATGADLTLLVKLDGAVIYNAELGAEFTGISHTCEDVDDAEYVLEIIMQGKQPHHTVLDEAGNIIDDRIIEIADVCLDNIPLEHTFYELADYTHDFNGTGSKVIEKFYGKMGCNGHVTLKFSGPIYLWLLENM